MKAFVKLVTLFSVTQFDCRVQWKCSTKHNGRRYSRRGSWLTESEQWAKEYGFGPYQAETEDWDAI